MKISYVSRNQATITGTSIYSDVLTFLDLVELPHSVIIVEVIALVGLAAVIIDDQNDTHALTGHTADGRLTGREERVDIFFPRGLLAVRHDRHAAVDCRGQLSGGGRHP